MKTMIFVLSILFFPLSFANPGKIETVKEVLMAECNMSVTDEEALRHIRQLYLSCIPDSEVDIREGCTVKCLKTSPGMVIGR
ncbi:hypothetical protein [Bdellovibrio reynosensis]|uniref:Uncharacterized protein n=1 Tax=Bdellovibrio reynosensis TaxID=2835041 RepID=A0ABY4CCY6_9BACT|nr:hypothetical protein [Bdellovibrio reynosensis]UOF01393.1 hypothetical protein MNR06_00305 [Bdellovibrio reynosensis]